MTNVEYVGDLSDVYGPKPVPPKFGVGLKSDGKPEVDPFVLMTHLEGANIEYTDKADEMNVLAIRSGTKFKTNDVWANYPGIYGIVRAGNGTDNIDGSQANDRRVLIMNTPEGSRNNVAELAISYGSAFLHKLTESSRAFLEDGKWLRGTRDEEELKQIKQKEWREAKVGAIGAGAIGQEFLSKAVSNGCTEVVFVDSIKRGAIPFTAPNGDKVVATQVELDDLLQTCDVVSIHTGAILDENGNPKNILGRKEIETMKEGAILLNTSREDNIDFEAALDKVKEGTLRLGVDVIPHEKKEDRNEQPIIQRLRDVGKETGRVIVTPHQGAETDIGKLLVDGDTAVRIRELLEIGVPKYLPINLDNPSNVTIGRKAKPGVRVVAIYSDIEAAHNAITGALKDQEISFGNCVVYGDGENDGSIATTIIDLPPRVTPEQAIAAQKAIHSLQGNFRVRLLMYAESE